MKSKDQGYNLENREQCNQALARKKVCDESLIKAGVHPIFIVSCSTCNNSMNN